MAATVAHEIAQPLQVIDLARTGAEEELADAARSGVPLDATYIDQRLRRIGQQIQRANRIVSDLRAFVRRSSSDEPGAVDPAESVRGAIDLTKHALREAGVIVWATVGEGLPGLTGRVGGLEQVLINLINNARDAGASVVEIGAELQEIDSRPTVRIAVSDNGPGVSPAILPKLFEQFVTTKPRGAGTGLGLRICRRIVEEMGGAISVANRAEGGARFEILLPVDGASANA
jgi:signal transduction histidine kinase